MNRILQIFAVASLLFVFALFVHPTANASHSWGGYHWARTSNPFTLTAGDNLSSAWKPFLATTAADWSASDVLDMTTGVGGGGKNCRPTSGRIEVCNRKYGNNGWLGLAQIWISGSHITQGVTKLNDTYFSTATYNTPAWKNLVMCQEVGHTLGLDHQDENFNNAPLGTCMDYTSDPTPNQHPNAHDYEELDLIYAHLDSFTTLGQSVAQRAQEYGDSASENPGQWGRLVRQNGRLAVFEKDFGGGNKLFTFVIFAE